MTIHTEHPFLPPDDDRSPARRFRGRLASPVTLWTASAGAAKAGLTVSSLLVADGDPAYVLGVVDPLSDLWDVLQLARAAAVTVLSRGHRQLADAFGYVAPAPGGPFRLAEWADTEWGPVPADAAAWAGCRLADPYPAPLGWGLQVTLRIEHVHIGQDDEPLIHRRGRYLP